MLICKSLFINATDETSAAKQNLNRLTDVCCQTYKTVTLTEIVSDMNRHAPMTAAAALAVALAAVFGELSQRLESFEPIL